MKNLKDYVDEQLKNPEFKVEYDLPSSKKRDIIFRGKRIDNGEWVYGFYIKKEVGEFVCGKFQKRFISIIVLDFSNGGIQYCEVISETVGQYTGLKDDGGKEIYEGDIVSCVGGAYHSGTWEFSIVIEIKDLRNMDEWGNISWDKVEIIGTIYD